jgi:hypothetical protein
MVEIVVVQIQLQATLFIGGDMQRGVDGITAAEMHPPAVWLAYRGAVRAIFSLSLSLMLKLPRNMSISATPAPIHRQGVSCCGVKSGAGGTLKQSHQVMM